MVKNNLIAKVLKMPEGEVVEHAKKMGIDAVVYDSRWQTDGFVTIIRNNWDLLSVKDIATLLEMDEIELEKLLVEYDFLDVKLGEQPLLLDTTYRPLTVEQEKKTEKVKKIAKDNFINRSVRPFEFFNQFVKPCFTNGNGGIKDRFISNYCAKYSGSLLDDDLSDYSDEYLERLASTGTNGIWISDTLRNLANFPFDESLSPDYKTRIKNLKKLIDRCSKYGMNVYLYINEPRSLPESFFEKYPKLKGQYVGGGTYCLCTSVKEVKDYLYNAVKSVAKSLPNLYAVMTISMSENPTHCYSRPWNGSNVIATDCPNCKDRTPQEVVAEVNGIIGKALKDGNGYTRLITNIWGWANYSGEDKKEVFETIDKLDTNIDILCVSEYGKDFVRGGVKGTVDDYSISVIGPSAFAEKVLTYAKSKGHRVWAKIQSNTSWECSAVPYLPTFGLMTEHVNRLKNLNVDGLMLGWSLGGYPGGVLALINNICENSYYDQNIWYKSVYGDKSEKIKKAVNIFDDAFKNYPFSVDSIYFGGHNMACGNLWSMDDNRESTMVCFTFDDYGKWSNPYGIDGYIELLTTLCKKWKKGLRQIENISGSAVISEFKSVANTAYIHFKSALNLAIFSVCKKDLKSNKRLLRKCIKSETELTKKLYKLITVDAKIGFEMTNHYYYNENLLLEKLVNLNELTELINQK